MIYNPVNATPTTAVTLIENAMRMCGVEPTTMDISEKNFALYLVNEILTSWANLPTMQFNEDYVVIALENNEPSYALPNGVYNVLDCNRVILNRIFQGIPIASEGLPAFAFDADLNTMVIQTTTNGWIGMQFQETSPLGTIPKERSIRYVGILSGVSQDYWYVIEVSYDGVNWNTIAENDLRPVHFSGAPTKNDIVWYYVDVPKKAPNWRVRCKNDQVVLMRELYFMEEVNSVSMGPISQSSYQSQSNKTSNGSPNSYTLNKTKSGAFLTVWPIPSNLTEQTPSITPGDGVQNNQYNHLVARSLSFPLSANYMRDPLQINRKFIPALRTSLSYYLSLRYAPDKSMNLKQDMMKEIQLVIGEDADQGSVTFDLPTYYNT